MLSRKFNSISFQVLLLTTVNVLENLFSASQMCSTTDCSCILQMIANISNSIYCMVQYNHIVTVFILPRYAIGSVERNGSIGWLHTLGDQLGKHFNDSIPGTESKNIVVLILVLIVVVVLSVLVSFNCKLPLQAQDPPSKTSMSQLCTSPSAV